ncbi:MAG TPA: polysaccharide deacetylase family protein [Kofleriaceae bacterium]|nr:polysaccharide deacetylase family protein [Kofleriaceae bacterium]
MPQVTLSFDNGPDPEVTPRVLDVLRDHGVTAHFFVLGKHLVERWGRRLVERAHDEGHHIGNHSFSHGVPLGNDPRPDAVTQEIAATDALLAAIVPGPRQFRPFGDGGVLGPHLLSRAAVDYLVAHGHSCVLWNSVPRDWIEPDAWPARALAACAAHAHTLVVLHDIPGACLAGLPGFLDAVRAAGHDIVAELPADCVPITGGRIVGDLAGLVSEPGER